jgi:hypothetical protein
MPEIHAARRARARDLVAASGAGAALITSPPNVRYLTGLASSNAAVLIPAAGAAVLATDSRYAGAAARQCPDLELVTERVTEPALALLAASRGAAVLAFEAQEMTVERYAALAAVDGVPRLVPAGRLVEELRTVKDDAEIGLLRQACAITDAALAQVLPLIAPGITERDLAIALERAMTDHGADGLAFESIVASGPNGAIPHHSPGGRELATGDLVTIDCGARLGGYHADMTRTVAIGEPAGWQREIYDGRARCGGRGRGRRRPRADRRGRLRRLLRPPARPWRGPGGPRSPDHRAWPDRYTHGPGSRHRRAGRLPAGPRRCQDRGHPGRPRRRRAGGAGRDPDHDHQGTARPVSRGGGADLLAGDRTTWRPRTT